MAWRKINGDVITKIPDVSQPWSPDALTVLPLDMLGKVLMDHVALEGEEKIKVLWGKKVVDVGSEGGKGWVVIEGGERMEADYVVGCDGANSQVRKSLFGDNYPGKTWDAQIVATNVSRQNNPLLSGTDSHTPKPF